MPTTRQFFSHRLIWLALLLSLGIGVLFVHAIWTMRVDAWDYAARTNTNLTRTLEQSLVRAIEPLDKSLEGMAREVSRAEVWQMPAQLRQRIIFDNSLKVQGAGDVFVLDIAGNVVLDSRETVNARVGNMAQRDFFQAFSQGRAEGLFIGQPIESQFSGAKLLPLARAYFDVDGNFAGVVAGSISLSFFNSLFSSLDLGPYSGVNLFRQDGITITRFPYGDADVGRSIAGTPNLKRFQQSPRGVFAGKAAIDGVLRLYSFTSVGTYPLIINVAQATDTVLAKWRRNAALLGGFALLLMVACLGLATLFVRELMLRQEMALRLREAEHDMRTILNNLPSAIGYWDPTLHNRFANAVYHEWYGVPPQKLRGMHVSEMLSKEDYERNLPFMERALAGEAQLFERRQLTPLGQVRDSLVSYLPDHLDGEVRGFFVQAIDITERKRMEEELFDEKERVRLTLQSIGDAVVCTDAEGIVTYLNPVAERLTGWQAFDAAGRPINSVVQLLDPHTGVAQESALAAAIARGRMGEAVRGTVLHRTNGQVSHVEETASPITDRHAKVTGAVAVLRDVTESVAMAERMAHMAHYDALTDLPNRVLLHDRAQQAIAQARRDGKSLAVMYLDLDGFKAVNDSLGHDVGDELLVEFAHRLRASVRATDTVCRQGGDEFVVLLPGLDGPEPACAVARKILAAGQKPFLLAQRSLRVGVSGGIAMYPQHGDTFDALSRHADSAMYAAKRAGRLRFMLYQGAQGAPVDIDMAPSHA